MAKNIAKTAKLCYTAPMDKNFEYIKNYNQIKFRYAGGKSIESGNEIHEYDEILYYIDGDASFMSENYWEELTKGTLLIIPKGYYHSFEIKNQDAYTRLVLNFPRGVVPEELRDVFDNISVIRNIGKNIACLTERMCRVITTNGDGVQHLLYSLYLALISELHYCGIYGDEPVRRAKDSVSARCIEYIDDNFNRRITADDIAAHLNISPSLLLHRFKSEMGTTLHRYITEKRLIYARGLMENGAKPTEIFEQCGFEDYSGFYKAFVKMFGYSPTGAVRNIK